MNSKAPAFNNPSFFNESKKHEEIDYESLQKVVKQDDREQHEPGTNRKVSVIISFNITYNQTKKDIQPPRIEQSRPYDLLQDAGFPTSSPGEAGGI